MSQPPPLRRSKPVWLRLLLVFGLIVGLLAGAVLGFNACAAAKLRAAIAEYEADGETLDFRSLLPEPVPDEQNFCAIPELLNLADPELGKANRERIEAMALPEEDETRGPRPSLPNGATTGKSADLTAWAKWLTGEEPPSETAAAEAVEKALLKDPELIAALIAAVDRPNAAWTPAWAAKVLPENPYAIKVPHYNTLQDFSRCLCLRTSALVEHGDVQDAVRVTQVHLRLARATLAEPQLVGSLVGCVMLTGAVGSIWDVCHSQSAAASDLGTLVGELNLKDLERMIPNVLRCEIATGFQAFRSLKRGTALVAWMDSATRESSRAQSSPLVRAVAPGLLDLNAAIMIEMGRDYLMVPMQEQGLAGLSMKAHELDAELKQRKGWMNAGYILAKLALPPLDPMSRRIAFVQGSQRLATTACRLEAHFAEHGSYPESLADLPPGMRYERTATRYRLWLPGPDGEDDGGKRILDPDKPEKTKFHADDYQGDWVWDYPGGRD